MSSLAPGYGQPSSHTYPPQPQPQQQNRPRPAWSLNDLSTELLALIFEKLRDIDNEYIATARLLCRRFNHIAIPAAYRTLILNERILSPSSEQYFPHALQCIYACTNHVVARSDLDPARIRILLERIRVLSSVKWRYVDNSIRSGRFWMPSDVLNAQQTRFHSTKLYVDDLPLREFEGDMRNTYLRAIPVDLLVSLKMAHPAPPLVTRLNSFKTLLLAARRLETLHFEDRGQGRQFDFAPNERLPPFRELHLRSYDWRHTPDEVYRHWDFSRITALELSSVPVYNFLSSVLFPDLANLHTLHVDDFSAHLVPDLRLEATRALYVLIRSYIRRLTTLSVTVHVPHFPLDAILAHADSLTSLRLRDHTGFGEEERRCPTLPPVDVVLLARHMRHLQVLELDMDAALTDPPAFLRALCGVSALHTLTLHVQTVVNPFEYAQQYLGGGGGGGAGNWVQGGQDGLQQRRMLLAQDAGTVARQAPADQDYEAAVWVMRFLLANRPGGGWRRITINVGGWKRVMVRRLSEEWRQLNEIGVFAERCFVLERNPGALGAGSGMVFREEFPDDADSPPSLPDEEEEDID